MHYSYYTFISLCRFYCILFCSILLIVLPASPFLLPACSRSTRLLQTLRRLAGACPRWSGGQLVWTGVQPVRSHWTALCTWLPTRNWRLALLLPSFHPPFLSSSIYLRASVFSGASSRSLVGPLCLGWLAAATNTHTGNTNTRRCRHVWPDKQWWEQYAYGGGYAWRKARRQKDGWQNGNRDVLSLVLTQKINLTHRRQ